MLSATLVLLVLSMLAGERLALPVDQATWIAMGYLVLLGSVVLFGLYIYALRRWTASALSYVTLVMPLVAVPLAALLIAEPISGSFIVGAAVVMVGVYVGAFLKIRPRRSSATSLPECLPIDACAEPAPQPPTLEPRPSTGTAT
jgi:drug/metabolite transporter (DMT)-like permease